MTRTMRFIIVGFGLISALGFSGVNCDPIVSQDNTQHYKQPCTKSNAEYKSVCQEQATCDTNTGHAVNCVEGCFCKDGYVLDSLGDCILPSECPGRICPQNSTYNKCAVVCDKTCMTQYLTQENDCSCKPDCNCLEGFVRDLNNNCIRPEDCDPQIVKCPENKVFSNCQSSVETCSGPILFKRCPSGCFCKDGWVLDGNNKCILKKDCPVQEIKEEECPTNQTYKECSYCGRSCENYYINIMFKCACVAGCACEDGYIWKNENEKVCVKPEDCQQKDTKCQDTQHYSDSEVRKTCIRPSGNGVNTTGCFCNDGLVYDEASRTCMKPTECPNAQCGPRQTYRECYKNVIRTCQDKDVEKLRDVEEVECKSICVCDGPFVWDEETSKCVHPSECPDSKKNQICKRDDPKSEFKECQSSTKRTCANPSPVVFNKDCRNECRCKDGFVFDEDTEKCMTVSECADLKSTISATCDANSTYSLCASACPQTCSTAYINNAMRACMACYEGCECNPGYYRTKDKRCVLIKDCPDEEINCPYDRQYKNCEHVIKTCEQNVTTSDTCLRGCFCGDDMVQDASGRCIYPSECPNTPENQSCQNKDVNSHYKNCQYVKPTCADPHGTVRKQKCMKGCFCNNGYVYYKKVNHCVTLDACKA